MHEAGAVALNWGGRNPSTAPKAEQTDSTSWLKALLSSV